MNAAALAGEQLLSAYEPAGRGLNQMLPELVIYCAAVIRTFCFLSGLTFLRAGLRALPLLLLALALGLTVNSDQVRPGASAMISGLLQPESAGGWQVAAALAAEAAAGFLISIPPALAGHQLVIALRLTDLLRGAQEAEQMIFGLADRGSVLERGGWLLFSAIIFCSGGHRILISLWSESFQLLPAAFLLGGGIELSLPALDSCLERFSFIALNTVIGAVLFSAPLIAASLCFDLARLSGGRLLGAPNFAAELQGLKLILLLLLGSLLVGSYGSDQAVLPLHRSKVALIQGLQAAANDQPSAPAALGRGCLTRGAENGSVAAGDRPNHPIKGLAVNGKRKAF